MMTRSLKIVSKFSIHIIIIIAVAIIFYLSILRIDRLLYLKAINDCANEYRIEYNDLAKNTKIIRPLEGPFRECVWNKGIKNWVGMKD